MENEYRAPGFPITLPVLRDRRKPEWPRLRQLRAGAYVPSMNSHSIIPPCVIRKTAAARLVAVLGFSLAALVANPAAHAQDTTNASAKLRRGDQHFLRDLIQRTEQNLAVAKLAQSDATDSRVRQLARTLTERDQELDRALTQFADSHRFVAGIPADSRWKWTDELRKASAAEYDRKFLVRAIDAHEELLGALKDAADDAKDPVLRDIAQSHVAQYKDIVDQAEKLKGSL